MRDRHPRPNACLDPNALRPLLQLQQLYLDVMHDGHLSALSSCTQLSALTADWQSEKFPAMQNLGPRLQPLTSVKAFHSVGKKCPPLHLFPSLVELDLSRSEVGSTQVLQDLVVHCQQLTELHIDVVQPEGFLLLQQLPALRELHAVVPTEEGVVALATLTQLNGLHVRVDFEIDDIEPAAAAAAGGGAVAGGAPGIPAAAAGAAAAAVAAAGGAPAEAAAEEAAGAAAAAAAAGGAAAAAAGGAAAEEGAGGGGPAAAAGEAASPAVTAAGRAAAEGAKARALLPLLQLRQKLEFLHVYGYVPQFPPAEAHAFVFWWGKPLLVFLQYCECYAGETRQNMLAAVQAWKQSQSGTGVVPVVDVYDEW